MGLTNEEIWIECSFASSLDMKSGRNLLKVARADIAGNTTFIFSWPNGCIVAFIMNNEKIPFQIAIYDWWFLKITGNEFLHELMSDSFIGLKRLKNLFIIHCLCDY